MDEQRLAIPINEGQMVYAVPEPEDQDQLAELFGDRAMIVLAATEDDLEGHGVSADVLVDVEGHALTLRLPNTGDAAALRRALAVGAVTATIVGAGAIAALQSPRQTPADVLQPARAYTQQVPAPALRADAANALREQSIAGSQAASQATDTSVPAPALRADAANALREQSMAGSQAASPATDTSVPAPALRADAANAQREKRFTDGDS